MKIGQWEEEWAKSTYFITKKEVDRLRAIEKAAREVFAKWDALEPASHLIAQLRAALEVKK